MNFRHYFSKINISFNCFRFLLLLYSINTYIYIQYSLLLIQFKCSVSSFKCSGVSLLVEITILNNNMAGVNEGS